MPECPPELSPLLGAFELLSRQRQTGFSGPQPIAVSDALAYLEAIPISSPAYFLALLSAMDAAFLSWAREEIAARNQKPPAP